MPQPEIPRKKTAKRAPPVIEASGSSLVGGENGLR
jgi:hypothetical protein